MNYAEPNMNAREAFFQKEVAELAERNTAAAINVKPVITARPIVVACMDERNTLTEEALGLQPHEVWRLATGGGRIEPDEFMAIFRRRLAPGGSGHSIYLVTHEVIGRPDLGCAAFNNDIEAQERYFWDLKVALAEQLPGAHIHVVSLDTSLGGLRGIDLDRRDDQFKIFVEHGGAPRVRYADENHGGYGIYVGEAYRAWNSRRNNYFHVSAVAPSLESDLNIALTVIREHSDVDLSDKPIVLHLDTPRGTLDSGLVAAKANPALKNFLEQPLVRALIESGELRIVRTATNLETWLGQVVQSVLETTPGL